MFQALSLCAVTLPWAGRRRAWTCGAHAQCWPGEPDAAHAQRAPDFLHLLLQRLGVGDGAVELFLVLLADGVAVHGGGGTCRCRPHPAPRLRLLYLSLRRASGTSCDNRRSCAVRSSSGGSRAPAARSSAEPERRAAVAPGWRAPQSWSASSNATRAARHASGTRQREPLCRAAMTHRMRRCRRSALVLHHAQHAAQLLRPPQLHRFARAGIG
jgi:hypothetical protein